MGTHVFKTVLYGILRLFNSRTWASPSFTDPQSPSMYPPEHYHFLSKTKMLSELKLVSSGDVPSPGRPALSLESVIPNFYFKAISTTG